MSKEIHALKDRTGQIFWPATATDAIIHPNTRLSLTDHIERYNLSSDDLILTLQDGIDKLVELEIDQHLGVQLIIKTEDGLIEEWTYYNSEEEFTSPEGWRKGGEIDTTLDATSENPVQNKAVYQAIIDNEEITAAALTELEERTATVETLKADLVNGKVPVYQIPELPASLLPTSLDDVLEFEGIENFPSTGSIGIIYVDTETNKLYRWKPGNNSNTPGNYIQLTTDLDIKSLVQPESSTPLEVGDSYDTAFGKLVKIIRDNEIVTAEALQDLNGRVTTSSADLSGKADLVDGKVPASQLPSFVDDVIEVGTYSNLPVEGESGKIYIVTDTNKSYRWSGSTYFEIAGGSESPLVIDLDEIYTLGQSVGQWSPNENENYYWVSIQLSDIPNTLDLQEICDAANENKIIYFKRGGQYYQVVKTGHTDNTSCHLTAYFNETEEGTSEYVISVNLGNQTTENLTLGYSKTLYSKEALYPVKKGISIVTGEVITSMLESIDGVTINNSSYYAIDLAKLSEGDGDESLTLPGNVFYLLAGNQDFDQRDRPFNLNRPVFFLKSIDPTTGVFNLLPLEKVDINYSITSPLETSQGITLRGEDDDNIYEVSIFLDNAGYSVPVTTTPKIDLESIIEEGQKVTAAGLNDLNERVLQNRSDIDELEEVTSISLNTLNERVEDLEDDVQGILDKENLIETTYLELKNLRDSGKLESGRFYRITDYQCTTSQENTASAGHQFDIVVLALGKDTLSEDAWAMMNESNIYNVTFRDGVTKKCWIYQDDYVDNIVDCTSLLGTGAMAIGEEDDDDVVLNKTNRTAICKSASSSLHESDLTYNYFQNSNLSAWKLKYALEDTTIRRFSWSIPSFVEGEVLMTLENGVNKYYRRSANKTRVVGGTTYYEWELIYRDNISSSFYNYCCYTNSENPEQGDEVKWRASYADYTMTTGQVISVDLNKDFGGRGIIYYMKDEYENECHYDFKNILFKRWAASTTGFDSSFNDYGSGTAGYMHWSNSSSSLWGMTVSTQTPPSYYYTFTKRSDINIQNCENLDASIIISGCKGNSLKTCGTGNNSFETYIKLNNIVILSGNYNKFDYDCSNISIASGHNNVFMGGCHNIWMRNSYDNKFDNDCSYIYLCYSSYNILGANCLYMKLYQYSRFNQFGLQCSYCVTGRNTEHCMFGDNCQYINFNNKSYYRYITIDSGNRNITLNCTSTTSSSQYYQNVTIAKGTNTTANTTKTITDSNVNQNYQTIYKPANCQEISV